MTNSITQRQLLPENLDRLAAQRTLYSTAKIVMAVQLILSVPVIIVLSILSQFLKSSYFLDQFGKTIDMSWVVISCGIIITLLDALCLSPVVVNLKEKAAKIQELFDCSVLSLQWNAILAGSKPGPEDIIENANKYKKKDEKYEQLLDWYSKEVGTIPLPAARILCQRSNIRWDTDLRKKVNVYLILLSTLTFFILLFIGIIGESDIGSFIIMLIAPCLPIFEFSIRYVLQNMKAIKSLKDLKSQAEKAWNDAKKSLLPDKQLEGISRQLQDVIYNTRKTNPLIFDKIYQIFRSRQENSMNYSCDQLVSDYKKSLDKS